MHPDILKGIIESHENLQERYTDHAARIHSLWRSFGQDERANGLSWQGIEVCALIPEWNLKDIVDSGPDHFLNILEHRATTNLEQQVMKGTKAGLPGDSALILKNVLNGSLLDPAAEEYAQRDAVYCFQDGDNYGKLFPRTQQVLSAYRPVFKEAVGAGILYRQSRLYQNLNLLVRRILEKGARDESASTAGASSSNITTVEASMASLDLQQQTSDQASTISALACRARDQKEWLDAGLDSLLTEPIALAEAVQAWWDTRPGHVPNQQGHTWPIHTDKYIGPAFFEAVHDSVKTTAISTYMCQLLEQLDSADGSMTIYRRLLLNEIGELCHLEFSRAKAHLLRHIQTTSARKWFRRVSDVHDLAENAKVIMSVKPEELTRRDPQMHYILRLCHADTEVSDAPQWLTNIGNLHTSDHKEREKLSEGEYEALCNLSHVVGFLNDIRPFLPQRQKTGNKRWSFETKMDELSSTLSGLRDQLKVRDIAFPIQNLRNPEACKTALGRMSDLVTSKIGKGMKNAYNDMVQDCLTDLRNRYEELKQSSSTSGQDSRFGSSQLGAAGPSTQQSQTPPSRKGKEKEKTRPQGAAGNVKPGQAGTPSPRRTPTSPKRIRVPMTTIGVFRALFDRSTATPSIYWTNFQAAMTSIGFTVEPRYGSVFTFFPPDVLGYSRSFTVHRPHGAKIEGGRLLFFASRLRRIYDWMSDTFVVA